MEQKINLLRKELDKMMDLHQKEIQKVGKDNSECDFDKGAFVAYGHIKSFLEKIKWN